MPDERWPRVMLVTDRHRLVADTGARARDWVSLLTAQIRGAVSGGVDLIQVREPDLDADTLSRFLVRLFAEVPGSQCRVVVNDRVDVARAVGALGVHLPERSPAFSDVRSLTSADKPWVIGRSVHSLTSVAETTGVGYLLAGTVLPSRSKPADWTTLGWAGLKALASEARGIPVVAIGGLTVDDVPAVVRAGATGIAAIGYFVPRDLSDVTAFVHERVESMRFGFDSPGPVSYTGKA